MLAPRPRGFQCYSASVLQCLPRDLVGFSVTVLQCFSVSVFQCFSVSVLAPRPRGFQCYSASVLQCFSACPENSGFQCLPRDLGGFSVTVLQCFSVTVLQCFSASVLQCLPRELGGFSVTVLQCFSVTVLAPRTRGLNGIKAPVLNYYSFYTETRSIPFVRSPSPLPILSQSHNHISRHHNPDTYGSRLNLQAQ